MQIIFENGSCHEVPKIPGISSGSDRRQPDGETWWVLDEAVGVGSFGRIELRPGFDLHIADYRVKESFDSHFENSRPGFGFGFWISGKTSGSGEHTPRSLYHEQGTTPVLYATDQYGTTREHKNSYRRSVILAIEPDPLHSLLRGTLDNLSKDFRIFLEGSTSGIFDNNVKITATISRIVNDLFSCSLEGAVRRLFLESKAMELIALRLDQAAVSDNADRKSHDLRADDVERIRFAARQLCIDLVAPPSLFELSASVGVSHAKLTNGFKQVFGVTPFEYLRQVRLNQAKTLLETHQLNVTESAYTVGYNSLSSFARAFRCQYGYNPHQCIGKDSLKA